MAPIGYCVSGRRQRDRAAASTFVACAVATWCSVAAVDGAHDTQLTATMPCGTQSVSAPWEFVGPATFVQPIFPDALPAASAIEQAAVSVVDDAPGARPGSQQATGNAKHVAPSTPRPGTTSSWWFVATVNGGVWRSKDIQADAVHWEPVTDNQPVRCSSMASVHVASFSPQVVLAGCGGATSSEQGDDFNQRVLNDGDWGGIMTSTDRGDTWSMTTFPAGYYVAAIETLLPTTAAAKAAAGSTTMVAAARSHFLDEQSGDDGGVWIASGQNPAVATWTRVLTKGVFALAYDPAGGVLAAAFALDAATVTISADGGHTWQDFSTGIKYRNQGLPFYPTFSLVPSKDNQPAVLLLGALTVSPTNDLSTNSSIMYRELPAAEAVAAAQHQSTSAPWRDLPYSGPSLDGDSMPKDRMALLVDPTDPDRLYIAGNGGEVAWRTNWNSTTPWVSLLGPKESLGTAPHVDCRNYAWDAESGSLILMSDGGIFSRSNPGAPGGKWRSLNGDIGAMEVISAHWDAHLDRYVAGAQDNDVQVGPPNASYTSVAAGVVMGDGTWTAVDNTQQPARLFGSRQFMGQFDDDDHVSAGVQAPPDGDADDGDEDDDAGPIPAQNAGLVFVSGDSPMLRVPIKLADLGFEDQRAFPYFVQPFALNEQRPTSLYFFANATDGKPAAWWDLSIPPGTTHSKQLKPPTLVAETGGGNCLQFVAGGMTQGKPDESVLVGMNSTHLYHRSATSPGGSLVIRKLPTQFAEPITFTYDADGDPIVGPVSHGKTVSLAVSPTDSDTVVVTGWPSVTSNEGDESIWISHDAGRSWENITGDIVRATGTIGRARPGGLLIVPIPSENATALLSGTVSGLFLTWLDDTVGTWTRFGDCAAFPLVLTSGATYEPSSDTLVAATMGRGVYIIRTLQTVLKAARAAALEI